VQQKNAAELSHKAVLQWSKYVRDASFVMTWSL